ncbi:MAG: hypothetical protein V5A21_03375 [Halapricum sp.]
MSEDNNTTQSRRDVLKSLGGAASFSSIAGIASATGESITGHKKRQVLSKDKVDKIYEKVGQPKIHAAKKIQREVVNTTGVVYRFYTNLGELRYISYGNTNVAQFIFGSVDKNIRDFKGESRFTRPQSGKEKPFASKDRLENPGRIKSKVIKKNHIPENIYVKYEEAFKLSGSIYSDLDGGIAYIRETTPEESSKLTAVTGIENGKKIYSTEKGGYVVIQSDESDSQNATLVESTDTNGDSAIKQGNIKQLNIQQKDNVSIQESCDSGACWTCLNGGIGWTATCGVVCVGLSWSGPVAIAACVGCAISLGIPVGYFCWKCYDTCR